MSETHPTPRSAVLAKVSRKGFKECLATIYIGACLGTVFLMFTLHGLLLPRNPNFEPHIVTLMPFFCGVICLVGVAVTVVGSLLFDWRFGPYELPIWRDAANGPAEKPGLLGRRMMRVSFLLWTALVGTMIVSRAGVQYERGTFWLGIICFLAGTWIAAFASSQLKKPFIEKEFRERLDREVGIRVEEELKRRERLSATTPTEPLADHASGTSQNRNVTHLASSRA
jgi:hypothetical protein